MKSLLLPPCALLLTGCTLPASDAPAEPGVAQIGQTIDVGGPKVTPLELLEDSRCPAEVDCVWPGQVRLRVRVDLGSGARTVELGTMQGVQVADGELKLTEVRPLRQSTKPIAASDYRFKFEFNGGL